MRLYRSLLTGPVAVYGREYGRMIGPDQVVDFDEATAPGVTLEAALGRLAPFFAPLTPDPITPPDPADLGGPFPLE